jgi:hypothetical protein
MLAYVFWHWRYPEIDSATYTSRLRAFHSVLAEHKPAGLQYSMVFCSAGAPWLPTTLEVYEDWYLMDGSAALDLLNEAAVSGAQRAPHDKVARGAAGGAGGLYRFRAGDLRIAEAQFALWLAKPPGMSYDDFYAAMQPWTSQAGVGLWGRQMTLGPTPEFCLLTPAPVQLPERFHGFGWALDRIWQGQ